MKANPYTVVFENLVNVETGQPAAKDIVYFFSKNPKTIFYAIGLPAVGKTTTISHFVNVLEKTAQNYKTDVTIKTIFFDKIQKKLEEDVAKKNPKKKNSSKWQNPQWQLFRKQIEKEIEKPQIYKRGKLHMLRTTFVVMETPSFLLWEKQSNGFEIIKKILAKKNQKFLVVYIVSDKNVSEKAKNLRAHVLNQPISNSQNNFKRKIENKFDTIIEKNGNSSLSDSQIREIVERMAPVDAITKVKSEAEKNFEKWSKNKAVFKKYSNIVKLPSSYKKMSKQKRQKYKKEAAYALFFLREKIGLSPERSLVVFNPYLENQKTFNNYKLLKI